MLLYFDNIITDVPLRPGAYPGLDQVRNGCLAYKMPGKLAIAMYTLASYSVLEWSDVIIKYELDDPSKTGLFEEFILSRFPRARIFRGRSDTQQKYRESVELIESLGDEWIFFAPNNDHPLIAPNTRILASCLQKAIQFKNHFSFVSIMYSHFTETFNSAYRGNTMHEGHDIHRHYRILDEDDDTVTVVSSCGTTLGLQVVHRDLLRRWFCTKDYGSAKIRRPDDLEGLMTRNQVIVIPKRPICEHFDGYMHVGLSPDLIPPLFIPPGFFENAIKIAYGYAAYREGWVNINPASERFSFRDPIHGTDLMITLEDVPLFWKERIKEIDINPEADLDALVAARSEKWNRIKNPWPSRPLYFALRRPFMALRRDKRLFLRTCLEKLFGESNTRQMIDFVRAKLTHLQPK